LQPAHFLFHFKTCTKAVSAACDAIPSAFRARTYLDRIKQAITAKFIETAAFDTASDLLMFSHFKTSFISLVLYCAKREKIFTEFKAV